MSTPAFRIVCDGDDITEKLQDRLTSLRIVDDSGQQSDSLELALDDRDKLLPVPRSGAILKVWLGYSDGGLPPVYMGSYAVDEVGLSMGGPRSMTVKASAAAVAPGLVKERKTRSWDNKTLQEIAEQIAKENGLQITIKGKAAQQKILHEDQTNESDQNFLTRLADRFQAVIKPADNKLVLVDRAAGQAGPIQQVDITQALDWNASLKNRGAYGSVEARYVDREAEGGVSQWSNTEKKVTASGATASNGGGASWTGGGGQQLPPFQIQKLFRTKVEAEAAAKSQLQSLQSGEVKITVRMSGDPSFRINAEGQVILRNFRPYIDGQWFVRQVTHELASGGYITTVECGTQVVEDTDTWDDAPGGRGTGRSRYGRSGPAGPGGTRGVIARTGSTGDSTGPHLDVRWADRRPINASVADRYIRINGRPPSSFGVTSGYGPRSLFGRSFHAGIDFGTPTGSAITLVNGATYVRNLGYTGAGGYVVEISTPEGNLRLLHLQAGSAR
jgi:phage protein D